MEDMEQRRLSGQNFRIGKALPETELYVKSADPHRSGLLKGDFEFAETIRREVQGGFTT